MSDEIIFEENKIRNVQLENVLQKTLEFNKKYLEYLEIKLQELKQQRDELNG
tara:strand:+ start:430 stop:585 length:156 start_codon:yes stop_codon:yes gene_type:complete